MVHYCTVAASEEGTCTPLNITQKSVFIPLTRLYYSAFPVLDCHGILLAANAGEFRELIPCRKREDVSVNLHSTREVSTEHCGNFVVTSHSGGNAFESTRVQN